MSEVNVASVVSEAKKTRKTGGKGKPRQRKSDPRQVLKHEGRFTEVPSIDFSTYRCPREVEFEDVLHYWQTRLAYLQHEASAAETKVNELASVTYEERNAAVLKARQKAQANAAVSKLESSVEAGVLDINAVAVLLAKLQAAQAAKALQG